MELKISSVRRHPIPEDLFGLFFEDINYAADGGLYAEMLENRAFEFVDCYGERYDYYTEPAPGYGWRSLKGGEMRFVNGSPVSTVNPRYLRFFAAEAGQGFANKAYAGIFLKAGLEYKVSFYARAAKYLSGHVRVAVIENEGTENAAVAAEATVTLIHAPKGVWQKWYRYETVLKADRDVDAASFCVFLTEAGEVEFDFFSMIPGDAVAGVFRKDLFEALKALKPGFMRFPGGCIIEGNTLENRYRWKDSVGPIENRRSNWNRWAVHEADNQGFHTQFSHYNQTLGLGYYEFFLLCELMGASPLPVMNVGLACQYQSLELVEPDSPEFSEFVQDALDLIEFANGDTDTTWGALRASMGHPAPFGLTMLGIGNEQWDTRESRFLERYVAFEKAIHAKYPSLRLIGSAGPDVISEHYTHAWEFFHEQVRENPEIAYAVDEHYYMPPAWFTDHTDFYDEYPRDVKVFSGEYAAHPYRGTPERGMNTVIGALSEAAFLTGVERNSDVVVLSSYAPLFARKDFVQWAPDLIWFNSRETDLTPSYYVQQFYSTDTATDTLETDGQEKAFRTENVFLSLACDRNTGKTILKAVNMNTEAFPLELTLPEGMKTPTAIDFRRLTAADETHALIEEFELPFSTGLKLPAQSFTVMTF